MALSIAEASGRQTVAAVYLRISSDPEGRRAGVERQREDCVAECFCRGWTPVIHEDNDVSASKGKRRPAYERMLAAVGRREVQVIVAYSGDRLHRSPVELERFIDAVNKSQVEVVTIRSGSDDLSTPDGRMVARIKGSVYRAEVEKMGDRIRRAKLQSAQRGEPNPGGRRAFGFEKDRVTHRPDEAEAIRDAARRIIDGVSLMSVSASMGMGHGRLKKILCSERIAGLRPAGTEVVTATWAPILDAETWQAVRSILGGRQRPPGGVAARKHLLSGFLVCFACGEKLEAVRTQGQPRYRCPGNHLLRKAEPLEEYIVDRVLAALESPELAEALAMQDGDDVDTRALADEVGRLEARLREAKKAWMVEGIISKQDFVAAKNELELRIGEIRGTLAARAGSRMAAHLPVGTARIRAAWEKGDLQQRRELIDIVVESVTLRAAGKGVRTLDPATIDIKWRI